MQFIQEQGPDALLPLNLSTRKEIKVKLLLNNVKSRDRYGK